MGVSSVSSSSSGTINSQSLFPAIEHLTLSSSSTETSSSACSVIIDKVISDIDLLTLILICVPVKSLLVFKSVSKQWFSIISDPNFAINNFRRLNPKTTGLFFEKMVPRESNYEVMYDFLLLDGSKFERGHEGVEQETFKTPRKFGDDPEPGEYGSVREFRVRISQSCNGLLCCNRQTEYDGEPFTRREYLGSIDRFSTYKTYIYNPTTRKYRCLPPSPFRDNVPKRDDSRIKVCSISLAFDPMKSVDYKVICIWKIEPFYHDYWDQDVENKYYLEFYSSKTNTWRKLNSDPFYGHVMSFMTSGVYWNGCLHWIGSVRYAANPESSMYFDVEQELVNPLPASPNVDESKVMYFGECGGHLYLVELLESCYTHYNILKMETDYSGWKLILKLDLESLIAVYPGRDIAFHDLKFLWRMIVFLEEDEAESLSKLVMVVTGKEVISYDLKEMSLTQIHNYPGDYFFFLDPQDGFAWGHLHHYIESLACV
ncbi:F-box protein At5g07610-like [Papaver somniferum]|uniref:F-box protein At5g07610-like n=1 Tax=Papaver somniferum TaxID=3469 RepID=UPI000E70375A|nr:F-box protein At5g07610-like [Papaver somniferum]